LNFSRYEEEKKDSVIDSIKRLFNLPLNYGVCEYCSARHREIKHASVFLASPQDIPPSHPYCRCRLIPINGRYIADLENAGIKVSRDIQRDGGALDLKKLEKYKKKLMLESQKQPKGKTSWLNPVIVGTVLAVAGLAAVAIASKALSKPLPKLDIKEELPEFKPEIKREPMTPSKWLNDLPKFFDSVTPTIKNNLNARMTDIVEAKDTIGKLKDPKEILSNLRVTSNDAYIYLSEKYNPIIELLEKMKNGQSIDDDLMIRLSNNQEADFIKEILFSEKNKEHSEILYEFLRKRNFPSSDKLPKEIMDRIKQDIDRLIKEKIITIRGRSGELIQPESISPFGAIHVLYRDYLKKFQDEKLKSFYDINIRISQARNIDDIEQISREIQAQLNNLKQLDNSFVDYLDEVSNFIPKDSKKRERNIRLMKDLFNREELFSSSYIKQGGLKTSVRGSIAYLDLRNRLMGLLDIAMDGLKNKLLGIETNRFVPPNMP
ncbi:MAG: hypothetical protein ACK4NC_07445, partial [Candidatus Gracilibacteria bacterium]